jgi:hypothetical protein
MSTENEASMQVEYSEQWGVVAGKEVFTLDEKQIQVLKQADMSGHRGIVWFSKFAISIPHIQAIYLISRQVKNQLTAGNTCRKQTPEERKASLKALNKAKRELIKKGVLRKANKNDQPKLNYTNKIAG